MSITTAPRGFYDDSFTADRLLGYRYRGADPEHRDNVSLRKAMELQTPLACFHGVVNGHYLAVWQTPDNLSPMGGMRICFVPDDAVE